MTGLFDRKRIVAALAVAILVIGSVVPALAFGVAGRVRPFGRDEWKVRASEGTNLVEVMGDGETDLDCSVFDRFGNLLGMDTDDSDHCIVYVHNHSEGNLIIWVENRGPVSNEYWLAVN